MFWVLRGDFAHYGCRQIGRRLCVAGRLAVGDAALARLAKEIGAQRQIRNPKVRAAAGAYSDYVELMAHFDAILPGRIHRLFYEDLVREPEAEIRRLLQYLGLPFEANCLRFHENARTMSSISAEQVRRPISGEASEYWRNYALFLGPLKSALGPVLDLYPDVPNFAA
jgi:hypothetical protein